MIDVYRILGWAAPAICFAGSAYTFYSRNQELRLAEQTQRLAIQSRQEAVQLENEIAKEPPQLLYAAAQASTSEEPGFLNDLKDRAKASGATIVNWTAKTTTYGQGQAVPADAADIDLVKGISRVECAMTVAGSYQDLRKFVSSLTNSNRLFTLNNVIWKRSDTGTDLTLSLYRYVQPG